MNVQLIQDFINLKQLLDYIADFSSKNLPNSELNDKKKIIKLILEYVSVPGTDSAVTSYLNKIQKYLSSDKPMSIQIIDDINDGAWDNELRLATDDIYRQTTVSNESFKLYHSLYERCSSFHFTEVEFSSIRYAFTNKKYDDLLFLLFKHAFEKYQTNLPTILSKRLYEEALTLSLGSDMRSNLFREAADLGNKYAAVEYGECVYEKNIELAAEYFVKAIPLQPAIWEIGFILEKNKLPPEKVKEFASTDFYKKNCESFFLNSPDGFELYIEGTEESQIESLRIAFIVYFYLANEERYGFTKAYNSLGKLLINNRVAISTNDGFYLKHETQEKGLAYLKKAIDLGNTNAMVNLATFYHAQNKAGLYLTEKECIVPMLEVAASLGEIEANVLLADIYLEEGNVHSAKEYLQFAHSKGRPSATFKLGGICETEGKYDLALSHYKFAMENGLSDAAYSYVLLSSSPLYLSTQNIPMNRFYLSGILQKHLNRMSDNIASKSLAYIDFLENKYAD